MISTACVADIFCYDKDRVIVMITLLKMKGLSQYYLLVLVLNTLQIVSIYVVLNTCVYVIYDM